MKRFLAATASALVVILAFSGTANATSLNRVTEALSVIQSDLNDLSVDASALDFTATSTDCQALADDTDSFRSLHRPHALARAAWRHLRRGIRLYGQGASLCVEGADNYDSDEIGQAADLIVAGNGEIDAATAAL